jgi:hypothetical protein
MSVEVLILVLGAGGVLGFLACLAIVAYVTRPDPASYGDGTHPKNRA